MALDPECRQVGCPGAYRLLTTPSICTVLTAAGGLTGTYDLGFTGDIKLPLHQPDGGLRRQQCFPGCHAGPQPGRGRQTANQIATRPRASTAFPTDNTLRQRVCSVSRPILRRRMPSTQLSGENRRLQPRSAPDRVRQPASRGGRDSIACARPSARWPAAANDVDPDFRSSAARSRRRSRRGLGRWAFGSWGHTGGDGNAATLDRSISGIVHRGRYPGDRQLAGRRLRRLQQILLQCRQRQFLRHEQQLRSRRLWRQSMGQPRPALRRGHQAGTTCTTSRSVGFAGYADSLGAGYGAGTAQVFGDLGYRIDAGPVGLELPS